MANVPDPVDFPAFVAHSKSGNKQKRTLVNGVLYPSMSAAARAHGLSVGALHQRLKRAQAWTLAGEVSMVTSG